MHKPADAFLVILQSIPVVDETNNYQLNIGILPEDM